MFYCSKVLFITTNLSKVFYIYNFVMGSRPSKRNPKKQKETSYDRRRLASPDVAESCPSDTIRQGESEHPISDSRSREPAAKQRSGEGASRRRSTPDIVSAATDGTNQRRNRVRRQSADEDCHPGSCLRRSSSLPPSRRSSSSVSPLEGDAARSGQRTRILPRNFYSDNIYKDLNIYHSFRM